MALDQYDKTRKKFNENFRKITKAEVADLTPGQRKIYNEIVANENIAAVPKSSSETMGGRVRLREFDSETFKPVRLRTITSGKDRAAGIRQTRRDKANEYKTNLDFPGASKGYSTELGMSVPKPKPRTAPREKLAHGGSACKGRSAQGSAEKS
jgi:hypothetical protein